MSVTSHWTAAHTRVVSTPVGQAGDWPLTRLKAMTSMAAGPVCTLIKILVCKILLPLVASRDMCIRKNGHILVGSCVCAALHVHATNHERSHWTPPKVKTLCTQTRVQKRSCQRPSVFGELMCEIMSAEITLQKNWLYPKNSAYIHTHTHINTYHKKSYENVYPIQPHTHIRTSNAPKKKTKNKEKNVDTPKRADQQTPWVVRKDRTHQRIFQTRAQRSGQGHTA